jgi:hypothetical protein
MGNVVGALFVLNKSLGGDKMETLVLISGAIHKNMKGASMRWDINVAF